MSEEKMCPDCSGRILTWNRLDNQHWSESIEGWIDDALGGKAVCLRRQLTQSHAENARLREEVVGYEDRLDRDHERITQLRERAEAAEAIVDKLPAKRILDCCQRILAAENLAMAADGPVEKTSRAMKACDLEYCLEILWKCRAAAEAALKKRQETPDAPEP